MKKKLTSLLLALAMVLSFIPSVALEASAKMQTGFSDVASAAWYANNVSYVYENGLMNGTSETNFEPQTSLTRAMFVTILGRMDGVDTTAYSGSSFADVSQGKWYSAYVSWGAANGIINGYSADTFGTNDPVTREQMATIIARYVDYAEITLREADNVTEGFTDAASVSNYAVFGLELMRTSGIITGYSDGTFLPKNTATRAEAATIFMRLDQAIQSTETENPSESTVPSTSTEPSESPEIPDGSSFAVHYIDVGQADAALILCDGESMLIDGGNVADSSLIYTYLKNLGIDHLNYMVCTHGHEDHVGGLAGALNYASVDHALCSVRSYDSQAFSNFVKYLGDQDVSIEIPTEGDTFTLGSAVVKVVGPINESTEQNNNSIVLRIVYGETSFLFTGDAEREEEQDILAAGYELSSTVLKVGHHGSDTSTTYPFLREVAPQYAVISVGTNNSYGHPTEATLSKLRDAEVKVYRTDMQGDIVCTSDGITVSFFVSRNEDADTLNLPGNSTTSGGNASSGSESGSNTAASGGNATSGSESSSNPTTAIAMQYVLNTNSKKFHYASCASVKKMSEKNKCYYDGIRSEILSMGYTPCGNCNP